MRSTITTKAADIFKGDYMATEQLITDTEKDEEVLAILNMRNGIEDRLALARSVDMEDLKAKAQYLMIDEHFDHIERLEFPRERVLYSLLQDILAMPT